MTTETPWHRKGTTANVRHMAMHENQLRVTVDVVGRLVSDQFPEWALLPITPIDMEGTVNAVFRSGGGLAARFPLQPSDIEATRQWLRSEADAALEWERGKAWAFEQAVGAIWYYRLSNPPASRMGRRSSNGSLLTEQTPE